MLGKSLVDSGDDDVDVDGVVSWKSAGGLLMESGVGSVIALAVIVVGDEKACAFGMLVVATVTAATIQAAAKAVGIEQDREIEVEIEREREVEVERENDTMLEI